MPSFYSLLKHCSHKPSPIIIHLQYRYGHHFTNVCMQVTIIEMGGGEEGGGLLLTNDRLTSLTYLSEGNKSYSANIKEPISYRIMCMYEISPFTLKHTALHQRKLQTQASLRFLTNIIKLEKTSAKDSQSTEYETFFFFFFFTPCEVSSDARVSVCSESEYKRNKR